MKFWSLFGKSRDQLFNIKKIGDLVVETSAEYTTSF